MNLNKEKWTIADKEIFIKELEAMSNPKNIPFIQKVVKTNMPILAIQKPQLNSIIKEISKGNFYSFLDLQINKYLENTLINISLISKITDMALLEKYLDTYISTADNWSSVDSFLPKIKKDKKGYFSLAKRYLHSSLSFTRRLGLVIILKFAGEDEYIDEIFEILDSFKKEEDYYVNMALAWVLCECVIKNRQKTLDYLGHHNLNNFVIRKGISKCRDSFRVSKEDKDFLLKFIPSTKILN